MKLAANLLVIFVALQHLGFLVLEMFLWTTPTGHSVFGLEPEFAEQSAALAANQGLYNGFLAAGLLFSLTRRHDRFAISAFFLGCVIVAGVFGAVTVGQTILFVQAAPALVALAVLALAYRQDGQDGQHPRTDLA